MYINTFVNIMLQLYLWHDFHNIIFKIKNELYSVTGSVPPPRNGKVLGVAPVVVKPNTITVIIFSPHPKSIQPFKTSSNCVTVATYKFCTLCPQHTLSYYMTLRIKSESSLTALTSWF